MKIPKIKSSHLKSNIVKKNTKKQTKKPQRLGIKKESEVGQMNIWIAYPI